MSKKARKFVKKYADIFGVPEDMLLQLLDEFLTGIADVSYFEFPDNELVELEHEGIEDAFAEWLDEKLSQF